MVDDLAKACGTEKMILLWYFYGVSHSGQICYAGPSVIVSSYIAAW